MGTTLQKRLSFDEAYSELSELICEAKINPQSEGTALGLIDIIKERHAELKGSVTDLERKVRAIESEKESLEERNDEDCVDQTIQGIDPIGYKTENLLDQQVMDALGGVLSKHGSLRVLHHLENFTVSGS
jgi:hypothetical protein